jgi:DNA-binding transcriptional LysR family regulator
LRPFSGKRAPERFSLRFDRAQMAMDAAIMGLGVALESATLASRHLVMAGCAPVFGLDKSVRVKAHFAVYPARHAKRAPVEAFLAWIHAEAARATKATG